MSEYGTSIAYVRQIVCEHFPRLWLPLEACLAAIHTLYLGHNANPTGLGLVGEASTGKGTVLSMIEGAGDLIYRSDNFTPRAFVSHYANRKPNPESDLLPKIKGRVLLVQDLAPVFSKRREDLTELMGTLTRVMDGQGYSSDSGVYGRRGYTEPHLFTFLFATTPFGNQVWEVMGKLGARLLFYPMPTPERDTNRLVADFATTTAYKDRVGVCQAAVKAFLQGQHQAFSAGISELAPHNLPIAILEIAARFSGLLAQLRGVASHPAWGFGNSVYEPTLLEDPHRSMAILINMAGGRALLYNRREVIAEDLVLVARLALGSCPFDRAAVFCKLLVNPLNQITNPQACSLLRISSKVSPHVLDDLVRLGLAEEVPTGDQEREGAGRPAHTIKLHSQLNWLLTPGYKELLPKFDGDYPRG